MAPFLFLISLWAALFLGEGFVRHFYPQQLIRGTGIYREDPQLGWRHRELKRMVVNTGEGPVLWATDERGFRVSARSQKEQKTRPEISILMIGDSFIEALSVEYEQTISSQIQQALARKYPLETEVVNAGVGAWAPGHYFLEAKRLLQKNRYDMGLIFFFIENDCLDEHPLHFESSTLEAPKTLKIPKDLGWGSLKEAVFFPVNNFLEEKSHLFLFLKKRSQILLARLKLTAYYFPDMFYRSQADSPKWEATAGMAERIYQEFQRTQTPVLFVFIPADYQVYPERMQKYMRMFDIPAEAVDLEQPDRKLMERLNQKKIPALDMLPIFRQEAAKGLSLYGAVDDHLNSAGHKVMAKALLPKIEMTLKTKLENA